MTLTGLYVPLITPFDGRGEVAVDALEALAHSVLDDGAAGIVALGTTAEPSSLTGDERARVVELLAGVCRDRGARLVVGTIEHPSATAALVLVPPFVRPGEAGVIAHFEALAAASPVPIIVYHVPHRTGQSLSAATIRRLAAIPGIVGIKYAVGGIDAETVALFADPPADFALLCGEDAFLAPMLALGAHGAIMASAHVATAQYASFADTPSDTPSDRALGHSLATLSSALFAEPNPAVIKGVLHAQGRIPTPGVRLPLRPAAAASVEAARSAAARLPAGVLAH